MTQNNGTNAPRQNRALGYFLRAIAIIAGIVTLLLGFYLIETFANRSSRTGAGWAVVIFAAVVGRIFWNWGSQHLVALGDEVLKTDTRPPIVYLRSFANEAEVSESELAFGKMFKEIGPLIAIGAPGEKLPALGAARLYLENENWKQVISDLIGRAKLVIIYGGVTPGLGWEVNHVKTHMNPLRSIIMVPNDKQVYDQFRQLAKGKANLDLPEFPARRDRKFAIGGTAGFVTFDSNWRPQFIKLPKANNRGRGSFIDDNAEAGRAWAALATICQKAGIDVPKPPRNWFMTGYNAIRAYLIFMFAILAILVGLYFIGILRIDDQAGPYFVWPDNILEFVQNIQNQTQSTQKTKFN